MRVLLASTRAGAPAARLAAFARQLARDHHDVTWMVPGAAPDPTMPTLGPPEEAPPGQRTSWRLAVALGRDLLRTRPDVALVRLSPGAAAMIGVLRTAGVPVVLDVDGGDRAPTADDLPPEGERALLLLAVRGARAIIAASPSGADRARTLGASRVELISTAEPPAMLPGTRDDAKRALELPLEQRFLAHTGPLEGIEALAEAHRRLPGVGLLLVAHGPQEKMAYAMAMSARPSAPVIALGPEAAPVALWAADVAVWLGDPRSEPAMTPLQLGRRLVAREDLGLYPGHLRAVHVAPPLAPALAAALEAEAELGSLPPDAVRAARQSSPLLPVLEAARR